MKLIGSHEVVRILGIKLPTLYAWVQRGKLNPRKVGKLLKFEEEEVLSMISTRSTLAWLISGPREVAVENARRLIGTQPPDFRLSYLEPPGPSEACVRVEALDRERMTWFGPALRPEGVVFKQLEAASRGQGFLFLGTPEPWEVVEFRPEESGSRSYLAAWIRKAGREAQSDLAGALERLEAGIFEGPIEPWTRDELHERGRS